MTRSAEDQKKTLIKQLSTEKVNDYLI